jgi:hypothetical protein
MRERVRGARWRRAAARAGAVIALAGVLAGAVISSQAHTVVRPLAEVSHPTQPPNDPR